jgi:hypothetical protein
VNDLSPAVVAGVVAFVTAVVVQWLQRSQQDRHRFTDLKRERYATFLQGIDDQRRQIQHQRSVLDALGRSPVATDQIPDVVRPESLKLIAQEIVLLAPAKSGVGAAAGDALRAMSELRTYRYEPGRPAPHLHAKGSLEGFDSALTAIHDTLAAFTLVAKKDLGSS